MKGVILKVKGIQRKFIRLEGGVHNQRLWAAPVYIYMVSDIWKFEEAEIAT